MTSTYEELNTKLARAELNLLIRDEEYEDSRYEYAQLKLELLVLRAEKLEADAQAVKPAEILPKEPLSPKLHKPIAVRPQLFSVLTVSNLSAELNLESLASLFRFSGNVISVYLSPDDQGLLRHGTVTMGTTEEARLAVKNLNGFDLGGICMTVRESPSNTIQQQPKKSAGPGLINHLQRKECIKENALSSCLNESVESQRLCVTNIPFRMTCQELLVLFQQVGGPVTRVDLSVTKFGRSRGVAHVQMDTSDGALRAMKHLNGIELFDRKLGVSVRKLFTMGFGGQEISSFGVVMKQVFIGGFPAAFTTQDLMDLASALNLVPKLVEIWCDGHGESKSCGFLTFTHISESEKAIKLLDRMDVGGKLIYARLERQI
ncbi:hypothetical protein HDU79_011383 [Rhizoclosmatium sp. JEL0117]|nr:hypothetical protein HDU79_011383 [Rhizoclosmatium sp. JEL0117]